MHERESGADMRFLYISPDGYPPVRVDAVMLFAKELTVKGYEIDWVLQSLDRFQP